MKGRQEIEMSDLNLQNEEEALYLIYVYFMVTVRGWI